MRVDPGDRNVRTLHSLEDVFAGQLDKIRLSSRLPAQCKDRKGIFEFIAISVSTSPNDGFYKPPRYCCEDKDIDEYPEVPFVNIMKIVWEGKYAHRLAIGRVLFHDWIALEKEWNYVLLE